MSRFAAGIKPGDKVGTRQLIGYVGQTGRATGPHLHFCVQRNGGTLPLAVPIEFAGPSDLPVTPESHKSLTAY